MKFVQQSSSKKKKLIFGRQLKSTSLLKEKVTCDANERKHRIFFSVEGGKKILGSCNMEGFVAYIYEKERKHV